MRNKKGFTLVELLAVVTILGIIMVIAIPAVSRWIDRGKKESLESQRKTLIMAAQSYAQNDSSVLPKTIGDSSIIRANDLKKANYLKEDIKDADKRNCMKDSFVRVYKYDKKKYTYSAYIYCEGDTVPDEIEGIKPNITITFAGTSIDGQINTVAASKVKIEIDGNVDSEGNPLGLDGYNYSISAQYNGVGELTEIFHSGSLNAGGRTSLKIEKDLSDYVDIRKANSFVVTVEAYNRDGGYRKKTANSLYDDDIPPSCGAITGEAGDDEWVRTRSSRTITVACKDNENGSGCVKDSYTKTFDQQLNNGTITISDNAGNETNCSVKVHIDWSKPSFTFVAYTRTSSGGKGTEVGRITVNESNDNTVFNTYSGNANGWLNFDQFPYGIYYEIQADDNVALGKGQWSYNPIGIFDANASDINTLTQGSSKTFTATDRMANVYLSAQGMRRAKYELSDKAGNKTSINIIADIDHESPTCTIEKSDTETDKGVTVTIICDDVGSGCSTSNNLVYQEQKESSAYRIEDNAKNVNYCVADITAYDCNPRSCHCSTCGGGTGGGSCEYSVAAANCKGKGTVQPDPDAAGEHGCGIDTWWYCQYSTYPCNCETCYSTCYK